MCYDRLANALKRLAILAVFLLVVGFNSPISAFQSSRAAPAAPQVALAPNYAWHTFYGSNADDAIFDIATDELGNIYLAGYSAAAWQGPGNVAPRHGFSALTDILVMKLSANGDYLWHTFYGSDGNDFGVDIAVDETGDIYIVGGSAANWLGDNAAEALHAYSSGVDLMILKLDCSGDYVWHTFYGANRPIGYDYDMGRGIVLGTQGDVYIAGESPASWLGDDDRLPLNPHSGANDIAVLKLSSAGEYGWHAFYGSSASDSGENITLDGSGAIYILGSCYGSWLGDEDKPPLHAYSDGYDIAVIKLDEQGAYQWHTFYGSSAYDDAGGSLIVDSQNNIVISAMSDASWNGDNGVAPLHAHTGDYDIALLKLNQAGVYQWHTFYGSGDSDSGTSIVVDAQDHLIVAGDSQASWQADGGSSPNHAHSGGNEITLLKLSDQGDYLWHTFYGSSGSDGAYGLAIDVNENLVISGFGDASWQGDGGADPLNPYTGEYDITVLKLSGGQYYLPLLQR